MPAKLLDFNSNLIYAIHNLLKTAIFSSADIKFDEAVRGNHSITEAKINTPHPNPNLKTPAQGHQRLPSILITFLFPRHNGKPSRR
jgi:hypothetical protein